MILFLFLLSFIVSFAILVFVGMFRLIAISVILLASLVSVSITCLVLLRRRGRLLLVMPALTLMLVLMLDIDLCISLLIFPRAIFVVLVLAFFDLNIQAVGIFTTFAFTVRLLRGRSNFTLDQSI